jgi:hypothetical protein
MDNNNISPFMRGMITPTEDGGIEAPENILKTVAAAYQQFIAVRGDHVERIKKYAAIEGMVSGNPPFDQAELEANGLGHITNFNNYKARSTYKKSAQGFWNLINSTEVFVKIVLAGNLPQGPKWAGIIARHFSDVVKEWEDFVPNFNLLGAQLTKFGICPIFFPHEESPLWEVIDVSRFYIPSQTQSLISKLSCVSIETTYTIQELYVIYTKIKGTKSPWNKDALKTFLLLRANALLKTMGSQFPTFMDLERAVSNNDGRLSTFFTDTVRLVNTYQKEYDNKISRYIFSAEMFQTMNTGTENTLTDFLYFVDRQYNTMEDAVLIFTACPGEWTIHGNIGIGEEMFAPSQAINMLDCSIVDMSRMSATPLVRTLATGGRETSQIRFYPGVVTDIGAAEFMQNNLGANINQLVGASQYLAQTVDTNILNGGDDPGSPDRAQGSIAPSEARSRDIKEFSVLRNIVAHFYETFDKAIRLSFVRFLTMHEGVPGWELAKEFKRRCAEDGVPEVLFDTAKKGLHGLPVQFRSVKASRVAGDGSTLARIMGLEGLDRIVPTFNQREMAAYKKEWVGATVGVDYIPTFASSDEQADEITGGASLARTEDGLMSLGKPALFSADNDQEAHADEHLGSLTEVVKAVSQQQMSPVDADKIMSLGLPHLTEHIQFMSRAPLFYQQTLNKVTEPYKQLVQWAQLNRRNAEAMIAAAMKKQQEDAAATQQVMDDAQRKDFVAQKDVERADFKVQQQVERAKEANVTRGDVLKEKVRKDADIKRLKVELEADVKQQATAKGRTQAELENTPFDELSSQLSGMTGITPSNVDFE